MTTVKEKLQLSQSADAVWKVIGSFGGLGDWHPAIEKLELEENGKLRRLHLAGGGLIVERLEAHDDKARSYSYAIVESPLPVKDYHSTLQVESNGGGCTIHWSSHFTPSGAPEADAANVIRGVYTGGFDAIKKHFGAS